MQRLESVAATPAYVAEYPMIVLVPKQRIAGVRDGNDVIDHALSPLAPRLGRGLSRTWSLDTERFHAQIAEDTISA